MKFNLSNSAKTLKASEIREILKVTERPEVISFAGGLPDPSLFPIKEIKQATDEVFSDQGAQSLQYSPTEGYIPLRQIIVEQFMDKAQVTTSTDEVLITAGSQQGIDFCAKIFLNSGDTIICEDPSYLGAINVFNSHYTKYITIPMDEDGMIIEELEKVLAAGTNAKLIYTIPDFQNPTGVTMSVKRRKQLADLANQYKIPVIEDSPYGDVIFEGKRNPAIKSFDKNGWVIYLGSFSKVLCPGLRIGWIVADHELLQKFILLKQISDLQCNNFTQRQIAIFMQKFDINQHIQKIITAYSKRKQIMLTSLQQYLPSSIKYTNPKGGMFTWVELPKHINSAEILVEALKDNVAFVPGAAFFANGGYDNFLRLNYSNMSEEKIQLGIQRIAKVLNHYL